MPQPKASSSAKSSTAKKPAAKKPAPKKAPSSKTTAAAKKPAAKTSTSRAKPAGKPAQSRASSTKSRPKTTVPEASTPERRDELLKENLGHLRELLSGGVVLSAQGVTDALENAVANGRMLRHDAEDLARGLLESGRRQSQLIARDLEQLLGVARTDLDLDLETPADAARTAAGAAKAVAGAAGDRVLREADRARRAAGIPPTFPILGYDDLDAGQIVDRLADLTPAQLRKVRDFERRNAERSRVLKAIDKALAS